MNQDDLIDLLHKRELRATITRLQLLQILVDYKSAMPISNIQSELSSIDRVTLYRTLESLKLKGIIHKAFQSDKETYYAICGNGCAENQHHHDHIHFRCSKCESVTCQKPSNQIKITVPSGEIHKVSIHVEGICSACLN